MQDLDLIDWTNLLSKYLILIYVVRAVSGLFWFPANDWELTNQRFVFLSRALCLGLTLHAFQSSEASVSSLSGQVNIDRV